MTPRRSTLQNEEGLTIIEIIITVAILGILAATSIGVFDVVKANARYSQIRADMDSIAEAAYNDYSTNLVWGALSFNQMPPSWQSNGELRSWPTPPCPGWYYSWEDWSVFGFPVTQVTVRRANDTLLWGYCVDTSGGQSNCQITDPTLLGTGSSATDLSSLTTHSVFCNE